MAEDKEEKGIPPVTREEMVEEDIRAGDLQEGTTRRENFEKLYGEGSQGSSASTTSTSSTPETTS